MPDPTPREVRVRMYRQGLGDCFLLTFPGKQGPRHMLIDCGALDSKHYDARLLHDVVADIHHVTEGQLDVVAATHEHMDHISGFLTAKDLFKTFDVKQVWVAWTEDPHDPAAKQIKDEFQKRELAISAALASLPDTPLGPRSRLQLYKDAITSVMGFADGVGAAKTHSDHATAWTNLRALGDNVYGDPSKPRPLELPGVEGVRVYVLGPPQDPDYIRKRESRKETYDEGPAGVSAFENFVAALSDDTDVVARALPFDERFRVTADEAREMPFFQKHYGFDTTTEAWRRIDYDWLATAGELALYIDNYTNNTCLALAIELVESGKVLLLPGDAQVGNWLSWATRTWEVKEGATTRSVKIDELLARTVLYKVGHHGSHNATLRANGLEKMVSPELVAMIPVHRPTAADQHWEFPYPPLWKRLKERARGRVLLADGTGFDEIAPEAQAMLSKAEWTRFKQATAFEPLYVEHRIAY